MKTTIRRCLSVLVAALAVSSMVGVGLAGSVGTATAQSDETVNDDWSSCSDAEKTAIALSLGWGGIVNDCNNVEDYGINQTAQDSQIWENVFSNANSNEAQSEILQTTFENTLNSSLTPALAEGKEGYVRYMENASNPTQSQARLKARQEVEEYYTARQMQLLKTWEANAYNAYYADQAVQSSNNSLSWSDVFSVQYYESDGTYSSTSTQSISGVGSLTTAKTQLDNGTVVSYETVEIDWSQDSIGTHPLKVDGWATYYLADSLYKSTTVNKTTENVVSGGLSNEAFANLEINPPSSLETSSPVRPIDQGEFVETWYRLEEQSTLAKNNVDDFVNGSYTQVESGTINTSELVDPYVGARSYDPDTQTSSWAIRSLLRLGLNPPENLSTTANMTVRDETTGAEHTGIFMSGGLPANESGFTVGSTYNATQIPGVQFVAGSDGQTELSGAFTLVSAHRANGSNYSDGETIPYPGNIGYETTNIDQYKNNTEQLAELLANIEARETKLSSSGSGGGFLSGNLFSGLSGLFGLGLSGGAVALIIGGVMVLLFSRS